MHMQMAEMGRKIASEMSAANGPQAYAEAKASAAADKAKMEHRLAQLSAEVTTLASAQAECAKVMCCSSPLSCLARVQRQTASPRAAQHTVVEQKLQYALSLCQISHVGI